MGAWEDYQKFLAANAAASQTQQSYVAPEAPSNAGYGGVRAQAPSTEDQIVQVGKTALKSYAKKKAKEYVASQLFANAATPASQVAWNSGAGLANAASWNAAANLATQQAANQAIAQSLAQGIVPGAQQVGGQLASQAGAQLASQAGAQAGGQLASQGAAQVGAQLGTQGASTATTAGMSSATAAGLAGLGITAAVLGLNHAFGSHKRPTPMYADEVLDALGHTTPGFAKLSKDEQNKVWSEGVKRGIIFPGSDDKDGKKRFWLKPPKGQAALMGMDEQQKRDWRHGVGKHTSYTRAHLDPKNRHLLRQGAAVDEALEKARDWQSFVQGVGQNNQDFLGYQQKLGVYTPEPYPMEAALAGDQAPEPAPVLRPTIPDPSEPTPVPRPITLPGQVPASVATPKPTTSIADGLAQRYPNGMPNPVRPDPGFSLQPGDPRYDEIMTMLRQNGYI